MFRDLHNNAKATRAITPVAVGTTGTGKTSGIIDRLGYNGVEFVYEYGSITATDATITPTVLECDTTGGSFTSVADADLIGTEVGAGIGQSATRTSGTTKNTVKQVGYKGAKRYLKTKVASTVTAGPIIAATALLHSPEHAPVS